jgi:DNA-binding response OmpR family regulator
MDGNSGVRGQDHRHALLIENDEAYGAVIAACLRLAGCRVDQVREVEAGFSKLDRQNFDLVVWGVPQAQMSPRGEVIAELRLRTEAPLVVIDADFEVAQLDLEAGADHWLPKPFVPGALVGSLRAALRMSGSSVIRAASRMEIRGMLLDGRRRRLTFAGNDVEFTRQEWELLSILIGHPDRFLGAREILRLGWRAGEHGSDQLRTYVHRLRRKLDPLGLPCQLLSQHGLGYCLSFQ